MRCVVQRLIWTALFFMLGAPSNAQVLHITTVAPQSTFDASHAYFSELLEQVLVVTRDDYGPFELTYADSPMTQARAIREIERGELIQVMWSGTNSERETDLTAIPIPLLRGLLGYRVLVIRHSDLDRWQQVAALGDLQNKVACQGSSWPDSDILEDAGLPVERISSFSVMYPMLAGGRCDYFPRGVHEVFPELAEARQTYPDLTVLPGLILYYPFPMYFFVPPDRPDLATRLSAGLERLISDGWLSANLRSHPTLQEMDSVLEWSDTRFITLPNRFLNPDTDNNDARYWVTPERFLLGQW